MNLSQYTKRTAFLTAITLWQISEFSMILIGVASLLHYLGPELLSLITIIGLITILISSYEILHADKIYPLVLPILSKLELKGKKIDRSIRTKK